MHITLLFKYIHCLALQYWFDVSGPSHCHQNCQWAPASMDTEGSALNVWYEIDRPKEGSFLPFLNVQQNSLQFLSANCELFSTRGIALGYLQEYALTIQ